MSKQLRLKLEIATKAMHAGKISAQDLEAYRQMLERQEQRNYKNPCTSLNPSVSKAFKSRR